MATDPLTAIHTSLRRFESLGLERPQALSVRSWLGSLAGVGLLDPRDSSEIAACYDSMRFGGTTVEPERWNELESELEESSKRFEALDAEKRDAIIKTLSPVSKPAPPPLTLAPENAEPLDPTQPLSFLSGRLRLVLAIGALAFAVGAGVYWLKQGDTSSGKKQRATSPVLIVDLGVPAATSANGIFRSRVDLPGAAGRAVSLLDADLDGDLDILLASAGTLRLFENRGRQLVDVSRDIGIKGPARSGQWADVDGDGDLDLAITATRRAPILFLRDGNRFERMPLPVPRPHNPEGLGWFDYDGDGDPDLVVTNGDMGVHLFNNNEGELSDVSAAVGFGPSGWGRVNGDFIHFLDFDNDQRLDILYAATTGLAVRNVDGKHFEAAPLAIKFAMIDGVRKQAMALGDIDGDRDFDVFAPQLTRAQLVENRDGEFTAVDSAAVRALANRARTGVFSDVDLDGDLDLVVAMRGGGLELLENEDGKLKAATSGSGLGELTSNIEILGMAVGDVDGDGTSDLVFHALDGKGGKGGKSGILLSSAQLPPGRGMLRISWETPPAAGTQIAVRHAREKRWQTRMLGVPTNSGSQQPLSQTFSLAAGRALLDLRLTDGDRVCLMAEVVAATATTVSINRTAIESATLHECPEN